MRLRQRVSIFFLMCIASVIALGGYSSAHATQWRALLNARDYAVYLRTSTAPDLTLSNNIMRFGSRLCLSDTDVLSIDRHLLTALGVVVIYWPDSFSEWGRYSCALLAALASMACAILVALRIARHRTARANAIVVSNVGRRVRAVALVAAGIVAPFFCGTLAWYITYPRNLDSARAGALEHMFLPAATGILVLSMLIFVPTAVIAFYWYLRFAAPSAPAVHFAIYASHCRLCRYDCRGIETHICPECGMARDASAWVILQAKWRRARFARTMFRGACTACAAAVAATVIAFWSDGHYLLESARRWSLLEGQGTSPAWRGTPVLFIPVPFDRAIRVLTVEDEVILRIVPEFTGPGQLVSNARYAIAERSRLRASDWQFRTGKYPRPGASSETLWTSTSATLATSFLRYPLTPSMGFTYVSVVNGRIQGIGPADGDSQIVRSMERAVAAKPDAARFFPIPDQSPSR